MGNVLKSMSLCACFSPIDQDEFDLPPAYSAYYQKQSTRADIFTVSSAYMFMGMDISFDFSSIDDTITTTNCNSSRRPLNEYRLTSELADKRVAYMSQRLASTSEKVRCHQLSPFTATTTTSTISPASSASLDDTGFESQLFASECSSRRSSGVGSHLGDFSLSSTSHHMPVTSSSLLEMSVATCCTEPAMLSTSYASSGLVDSLFHMLYTRVNYTAPLIAIAPLSIRMQIDKWSKRSLKLVNSRLFNSLFISKMTQSLAQINAAVEESKESSKKATTKKSSRRRRFLAGLGMAASASTKSTSNAITSGPCEEQEKSSSSPSNKSTTLIDSLRDLTSGLYRLENLSRAILRIYDVNFF